MRTILMPVSNGFVARNFLRGGLIENITKSGIRAVLLSPAEKLEYYKSQFNFLGVEWEILPEVSKSTTEQVWKFLEFASIPTSTVKLMHFSYLFRKGTKTPFPVRIIGFVFRFLLWCEGHLKIYRKIFRTAYSLKTRSKSFSKVIEKYKPDLVFCPTLIYGGEFALIKEARIKNVMTIGIAASWDNFTSKTFLRAHPDYLLAQTEIMKRDAVRYGDFPRERIEVIGVPQYDGHFRRDLVIPRDEFCKIIGADPSKKIILFAFSGKVSVDVDWEALSVLAEVFRSGKLSRENMQVLVRPYPKRKLCKKEYARVRDEFGFLIESPVERIGTGKDSWEFDEKSLSFMRSSIINSDIVISACSTFFVEAAIFGKPLVAISFGPTGANYWNSAKRFFEWNHLADLKKTGGIWRAKSAEELVAAIKRYLSEPELHGEQRREIVSEQAVFSDGKSLERISGYILNKINFA